VCNRQLKFSKLFEFAKKQGIKYVATGHYARLRPAGFCGQVRRSIGEGKPRLPKQKYQLLRPKDKSKDQTYFLSFLPQKWLSRIIFPLGDYTKKEVYQIAKENGLPFFNQKEQSQDFCFVAGKSLPCFLEKKIGQKPGKIIDAKGQVIGKHQGLHFYTIGQRKGLNIPGGPYFVASLDRKRNLLIVARNRKEVAKKEVILGPFNFISGQPPKRKIIVRAKTRYNQPASKAILYPPKKGKPPDLFRSGGKLKIVFDKAQFAITPGQFSVFYLPTKVGGTKTGQKDICLGAGVIN
jgi:tRNA-specific 2-thiouridylase